MEVIIAKVKTSQPKEEIKQLDKGLYEIKIKEAPEKGKANQAIIKFLTKRFKKHITIIKGKTSKTKTIKLD